MIKKIISIIASIMPNIIKINFYRLIGYKIGRNVRIGFLTLILANKVSIEDNVRIGSLNVFKMNKLFIGSRSIVRSLNMMIGPANLILGKRVQIVGPFTFMNLSEDIELENHCGIGSHSIFYTHGVYLPYTEGNPRKFGKIHLGKRVWSPAHVIFLPGVQIGEDSIITAGSLVNASFPVDSLISGNPAKLISKASRLKTKITKEELHKRMKEIIQDFSNHYTHSDKTKFDFKGNELIIKERKKEFLIKLQFDENIPSIKKYNEVIFFGENFGKIRSKKISLFDLKKRKKIINGELAKKFYKYLENYGEYFD
jgi:acetyltransferase-like isoleucine patch superfamily enzyme